MKFPKPTRGSARLERDAKRKAIAAHERKIIAAAKKRDGYKCRWPRAHVCRGRLEGAHLDAKGMGGDHGLRTTTANIVSVCAWIHRTGPETLHNYILKIQPETPCGADGILSFWRTNGEGEYYRVAMECTIGVVEPNR